MPISATDYDNDDPCGPQQGEYRTAEFNHLNAVSLVRSGKSSGARYVALENLRICTRLCDHAHQHRLPSAKPRAHCPTEQPFHREQNREMPIRAQAHHIIAVCFVLVLS